jgi:hypothetical protein
MKRNRSHSFLHKSATKNDDFDFSNSIIPEMRCTYSHLILAETLNMRLNNYNALKDIVHDETLNITSNSDISISCSSNRDEEIQVNMHKFKGYKESFNTEMIKSPNNGQGDKDSMKDANDGNGDFYIDNKLRKELDASNSYSWFKGKIKSVVETQLGSRKLQKLIQKEAFNIDEIIGIYKEVS